jgi:hypothetical protein
VRIFYVFTFYFGGWIEKQKKKYEIIKCKIEKTKQIQYPIDGIIKMQ